jgi:hypothetical protein
MARFRTMAAFYSDAQGVGKVSAGRVVASSQGTALFGDVVWVGLNAGTLPAQMVPLDAEAAAMKAASRWADEVINATILGADSVG